MSRHAARARSRVLAADSVFQRSEPGVTYSAIQPVSWSEPTVLERRYRAGNYAGRSGAESLPNLLHDDYAYVFEALLGSLDSSEGADRNGC